jgi:hypothetical protein
MAERLNVDEWKPKRNKQGKILDEDFMKLCCVVKKETVGGSTKKFKGMWGNKE